MSDPFLGQIMLVGFNFPPTGWARCDGQILQISQNSALFSLLGTTYGGDGRVTFALPDLRSRVPVHVGTGAGLDTISWGEKAGSLNIAASQLPAHTHGFSVPVQTGAANTTSPSGNWPAVAEDADRNALNLYSDAGTNATGGAGTTGSTGSGGAYRQPFLGMYYCIALTGIFPSIS
ncbi:MAG: tail fiber protein [Planctomycetota bacterium]|nr:tail fiber protein [Planctomycetota bacterium]